jgi:hypothetical protein
MYSTGICRGTERRKCHLRPLSLHVHAASLHAHMRMQGGGQTERDTHAVHLRFSEAPFGEDDLGLPSSSPRCRMSMALLPAMVTR